MTLHCSDLDGHAEERIMGKPYLVWDFPLCGVLHDDGTCDAVMAVDGCVNKTIDVGGLKAIGQGDGGNPFCLEETGFDDTEWGTIVRGGDNG